MHPTKLPILLAKVVAALKPGSYLFFRDYAVNDMAAKRFSPSSKLEENFYTRGDGTLAYYFTLDLVDELLTNAGLHKLALTYQEKDVVNHKEGKEMHRIWVQAKYVKPTTVK
eukprot:c12372_g1_i4.p1 GENE.c12372_g1_i4~~c12372_g1_i4.p1  ORF type:complete len:112 (+),score=27.40 c12372_g1_i4:545-880(+)